VSTTPSAGPGIGQLVEAGRLTLQRLSPVPGLFAFQLEATRSGHPAERFGLTHERTDRLQEAAVLAGAGYEVRVVALGKTPLVDRPLLFGTAQTPNATILSPATPAVVISSAMPTGPSEPRHFAPPPPAKADRASVPAPAPAGPVPDTSRIPEGSSVPAPPEPAAAIAEPSESGAAHPRQAPEVLPAKPVPAVPTETSAERLAGRAKERPRAVAATRKIAAPRALQPATIEGAIKPRWTRAPVTLIARVLGFSPDAKLVYYTALIGPRRTVAPGLSLTHVGDLARMVEMSSKRVRGALEELEEQGLVIRDDAAGVLFLPDAVRDDPPDNSKVVTAWAKALRETPDCAIKGEIKRQLVEGAGRFSAPLEEGIENGIRNGIGNGTPTQLQRQMQTQIQGQPQKQGAAAPSLEEVLEFAHEERLSEVSARKYHGKRSETGWRGILDWRAGLRTWAAEDSSRAPRTLSGPSLQAVADGSKYGSQKLSPEAFDE
jgi:hypothetical protein